jgi:hypothetical protein
MKLRTGNACPQHRRHYITAAGERLPAWIPLTLARRTSLGHDHDVVWVPQRTSRRQVVVWRGFVSHDTNATPDGRSSKSVRHHRGYSLGEALSHLRAAYAGGGIDDLLAAYNDASAVSSVLRRVFPILERVYPVQTFLELASKLNHDIDEHGLHVGCQQFLNGLSLPWECKLSAVCEETAHRSPVIFYGNHPSMLTPFLLAASVDRPDLRYFSTSYVCRLVPSFGERSYPMELPLTRSWTEWRRGGLRRVLAYRLVSLLHALPDVDDAKQMNHRGLEDGADHVRRGGCVMICPGGGGKRDRRWYPGIGVLVKALSEHPAPEPVYMVPVTEENCTNKRIYTRLMHGPMSRVKRSVLYRRPIRITFSDPVPLTDVASPKASVRQVVEWLRTYYEALATAPVVTSR